jgi:glycosyltransferase involved in cell wall biosynthesis
MRLLFFAGGSYVYGHEIVLLDLMGELKHQGHDVLAVVSGWNDGDFPARLARANIAFVELKLGRLYLRNPRWTMDTLRHLPSSAVRLLRAARKFAPDAVVHSDEAHFQVVGRILRTYRHYFYAHNLPNRRWYRDDGTGFLQSRMERFVTCSEFLRGVYVDAGIDRSRTRAVLNGVSELLATAPQPPPQRPASISIGIIGQLVPRKRHAVLFDAVDRLDPSTRANLRVLVFGNADTAYGHDLKSRFADARWTIEWRGFEPDRNAIYGAIDVVACPFIGEPFGLVAAEAGAFGRPVIAAQSGALPEIVVHGRTGLLVPPDDPQALAAAITRIVSDGTLRSTMGVEARRRVEDFFSIERQASEFVAALN